MQTLEQVLSNALVNPLRGQPEPQQTPITFWCLDERLPSKRKLVMPLVTSVTLLSDGLP